MKGMLSMKTGPNERFGHLHAEAFCLMKYRSDDGTEEEVLWNSRDGVTPFCILSRTGKTMTHVAWDRDEYRPNYQPKSGERIFVDLTPERARELAISNADVYWDDPTYPASKQYTSKNELVDLLVQSYLSQPGEPTIINVDGTSSL